MKAIIAFLLVLTSFFSQSQTDDIWIRTTQSNLGTKAEWETYYKWSEPVFTSIDISVTTNKITVYAQNTFIVRITETIRSSNNFSDAIFKGIDDEGIRCIVRIGKDSDSGQGYIAFEYSNLCFFYFAERL